MSDNGLRCCTVVLEFNYGDPGSSLGSVWLRNGDGRPDFESDEPLESLPGWVRIVGPIDYDLASSIQSALAKFLADSGVVVIDEGIAD